MSINHINTNCVKLSTNCCSLFSIMQMTFLEHSIAGRVTRIDFILILLLLARLLLGLTLLIHHYLVHNICIYELLWFYTFTLFETNLFCIWVGKPRHFWQNFAGGVSLTYANDWSIAMIQLSISILPKNLINVVIKHPYAMTRTLNKHPFRNKRLFPCPQDVFWFSIHAELSATMTPCFNMRRALATIAAVACSS